MKYFIAPIIAFCAPFFVLLAGLVSSGDPDGGVYFAMLSLFSVSIFAPVVIIPLIGYAIQKTKIWLMAVSISVMPMAFLLGDLFILWMAFVSGW